MRGKILKPFYDNVKSELKFHGVSLDYFPNEYLIVATDCKTDEKYLLQRMKFWEVLAEIDDDPVEHLVQEILNALRNEKTLFD